MSLTNFFIKPAYTPRLQPIDFTDSIFESDKVTHPSNVYAFAAYLARYYGAKHIIDIGCGHASTLAALHSELDVIGVGFGPNIAYCRQQYSFGRWIEWDLERVGNIPIEIEVARHAVVICADVIEHLIDPTHLLKNLYQLLDYAPAALLSTPERDLVRGKDDLGPPTDPHHVREWNLFELQQYLSSTGLRVAFSGLTFNNDCDREKKTSLIVLENNHALPLQPAPPDFTVVAIINAYNEADIVVPALRFLIDQGINVYLVDNWSTDTTLELAKQFENKGLVGWERFPPEGPSSLFNWESHLHRVEELSRELEADWFIHHDMDEERLSPWLGVSYRDGLYHVDRCGYTCIDHTLIEFHPIDNSYRSGNSLGQYFKFFEFGKLNTHSWQVKAWKNLGYKVSLASAGGHEVRFPGAARYPYKFLIRHYPVRSQEHGIRKLLHERKLRVDPQEHARGWNMHYDHVEVHTQFLKGPEQMIRFEPRNFYRDFLVERLSGISLFFENGETTESIWLADRLWALNDLEENDVQRTDVHWWRSSHYQQRQLIRTLRQQLREQQYQTQTIQHLQSVIDQRNGEINLIKGLKIWRVMVVYWEVVDRLRALLKRVIKNSADWN